MVFDRGTYLTFGLAIVCILLTLVAISAQADEGENIPPQPEPIAAAAASRDINPARDLITRQLAAIRHRDADMVWALTTDDFHEKFDTAKDFLSHLRFRLRPIYNHEDYKFLNQSETGDSLIQKVEMEDSYGDPVMVIYRLEQQDDGQWLIDSFAILAPEAQPI